MLGKQGWKLVSEPDTTASKIFKARYYPHGDFLNAKLGHNPSFTWRSIWSSQIVLSQGYRWKIGDGHLINAWNEPWLRDSSNLRLETPLDADLQSLTVSDLMIPGRREWDYGLLEDLFSDRDVQAISDIPLRNNFHQDLRIWHFSPNGRYTVKSGYRLMLNLASSPDMHCINGDWCTLWKTRVPPKVKFFAWRACRNCIPTRAKLKSRGIQVPLTYVLCGHDVEHLWHVFITCDFARDCWREAKLLTFVMTKANSAEEFSDWFFSCLTNLTSTSNEKFLMTLWSIWKQRNAKLWNGDHLTPSRAIFSAMEHLYEWLAAKKAGCFNDTSVADIIEWKKPPVGFLKCNVDAAFFNELKAIGIGLILRDQWGGFVLGRCCFLHGIGSVREGEAFGLLEALSWLRNLGFQKVIFEGDAKCVYKYELGANEDVSEFGFIMNSCRAIFQQEVDFSTSLVRRQANEIAHILAKESRCNASPVVWIEPPNYIVALLSGSSIA